MQSTKFNSVLPLTYLRSSNEHPVSCGLRKTRISTPASVDSLWRTELRRPNEVGQICESTFAAVIASVCVCVSGCACGCVRGVPVMRVVAPLLVVLGHLLAASVHAVPSAACSEVMIWTEHEIDVYLNALPDDALRDCVQVALFSAVDGGRQDAVRFILNHPRCQVDGLTVTRVAWYAYARWRHNRISNAWRTLGDDLMPLLQSAYQLTEPDILRRFDVNYEVFPPRDSSRSSILQRTPFLANPPLVQEYNPYYDHAHQRSVQTPHLDFIRGAYQHQQVHQHEQPQQFVPGTPATPRHAGQCSTRPPRGRTMPFSRAGYDYQALEAGLIWLEPHPAFLQAALPRQTTHVPFGTIQEVPEALSSLSSIRTPVQLSPVESASRHRQRDGLESLRSQIRPAQPRSQRATAQAPAAPGGNSNPNPNAQRPPRAPLRLYHAPYPQLRSNAVARVPESHPRDAVPQEQLSGSVPIPDWKYLLKDGSQHEQGQEFLNRVAGMIEQGDERLRGRLFVKSESSSAIDEGGLSASLIQFASAELVVRLGRDGQILYSQSMDRAFVPRSPTIETDDERKHLVLLGALIGIIDNHRRMGPNRVLWLPIPLPVVAFRALLADGALATITDDDASGTALAAVYKQYCGDRSPSQCNRDTQVDIVDLFPPVPGYDGDTAANEYLRGLVGGADDRIST